MSGSTSRRSLLFAAVVAIIAALPLEAQQRPFTPDVALGVRSARIEDVTPDGRWVALSVRVRGDGLGVDHGRFGDPTYVSPSPAQLELVDVDGGRMRMIFPDKVQVRGVAFSKDGSKLAFLRLVGDDWVLYVHDIGANRTRRVNVPTEKKIASVSPLTWSPDGASVLVTLRPEGWAQEARQAFLDLSQGTVVVQDSKNPFLAWDRVRNLDDRQIPAVVSLSDGAVREVLPETEIQGARFSSDGYLAYITAHPLRTSYERGKGTEYGVFRLSLAPGSVPDTLVKPVERRVSMQWNEDATAFAYADKGNVFVRMAGADSARNLTAQYRKPVSETDTTKLSFSVMAWRPDGGALLVSAKDGYHLLNVTDGSMELVYPFQGDEETRPDLGLQGWSRDGRYLFLSTSARDHWERGLLRYDLQSRQETALVRDADVYGSWHVSDDGTRFVFTRSDGDHPNEVYAAGPGFSDVRALTHLNPQLADVALTHSELIHYLDVDGKKLYGVLYYPANYQPGKKYPLVAEVYETFFDNGFNENMNLLAAQGWFVLRPSVNLQIGYPGEAWIKGVTTAINSLIDRGLVDGKKLGVEGQSYGGYATNLLITQTDRFAAAVNVSGKVDIISFLGDSPKIGVRNYSAAEEGQDRIGATLWEQPLKYVAHSAVMYADRIKTPLLMLTGKEDWNVPDTNEREMYYALRRLGKEAVWVQYARGGHGAGRAGTVDDFKDHWGRIFDWFATHFAKVDEEKAEGTGGR